MPGFSWSGSNIGIKDDSLDFAVAYCERSCAAAGVFTRNNFPGAPVVVGREHLAAGALQAIVVNSKNANVATGPDGLADARRCCKLLGEALGIAPELVLPSSTGVIGVPLPMKRLERACREAPRGLNPGPEGLQAFARAILTTDTRPKAISLRVGAATLTGVAKGAGMIEPHMATMLAYFFTDAALDAGILREMLGRAVDKSFNRISIDTDTSTSDTVVVMANGLAGAVPAEDFEAALSEATVYLAKEIARDGEGATKLIELIVCEAPSQAAALAIAKSIVNSPLVKTAIYGADPNWGRFVMAVGKVFEHPTPLEALRIEFGGEDDPLVISMAGQTPETLQRIARYLGGEELRIRVRLGQGKAQETVWGCDLTEGYVKENAEYTT
ncbi:MAG: bifunctional glutamate N-acetyltransferase/amino-acid acetyltransferase ArgJ [SAR324 cluster bacterium]|nr:bifunctional glutamate N-acetyltransferase/amino-acid acetyltransferase ArgJ [SAR324 cluster bacterium]